MNGLIEFEGKEIRTVQTDRGVEWVAADVCDVLGISSARQSCQPFTPLEKGVCTMDTLGGPQEVLTVTEPGLYRLIFKSRKPEAERFQQFVFSVVLPCIRKHGCYPAPVVESGSRAVVEIDHESMGLEIGKYVAIGFRDELKKTVSEEVQPIRDDIAEFKNEVCTRLDSVERRKKLTEKTKKSHRYIINQYYQGMCPCCRSVLIVNSARIELSQCEDEHWVAKSMSGIGDTWMVCKECNSKLRDRDFKQQKRVQFEAYQDLRRQFQQAIQGPLLPGMNPES